jgi:hypothetical protein
MKIWLTVTDGHNPRASAATRFTPASSATRASVAGARFAPSMNGSMLGWSGTHVERLRRANAHGGSDHGPDRAERMTHRHATKPAKPAGGRHGARRCTSALDPRKSTRPCERTLQDSRDCSFATFVTRQRPGSTRPACSRPTCRSSSGITASPRRRVTSTRPVAGCASRCCESSRPERSRESCKFLQRALGIPPSRRRRRTVVLP